MNTLQEEKEKKLIKPKQSLGQNFFVNKRLAKKIVSIVAEVNPQTIIEIGPGTGTFTSLFLQLANRKSRNSPHKIIAIEKDDLLSLKLRKNYPKLNLIHNDILNVNLYKLIQNAKLPIVIFGSLPYNLSKKIITFSLNAIRKLILRTNNISKYDVIPNNKSMGNQDREKFENKKYKSFKPPCFFIIQKEVAQKYIGNPHNNFLSLTTKLTTNAEILFDIKPGSFTPRPKVTSSLIKFIPNIENIIKYSDIPTQSFRKFLITCFSHPRKILKNNLDKTTVHQFETISPTNKLLMQRPHELTISDFVFLYRTINE